MLVKVDLILVKFELMLVKVELMQMKVELMLEKFKLSRNTGVPVPSKLAQAAAMPLGALRYVPPADGAMLSMRILDIDYSPFIGR